jgi:hypothetical protein
MVALIKIAVQLLADAARFAILIFRPTRSIQAENLFLRRQLALYSVAFGRDGLIRRQELASRFWQGSLTGEMRWS